MPITNIYQRLKELFLVVLIILGLFTIPALRQWGDPFAGTKTITVSAEGKTTATPDIANISFSVISEGDAEFAQSEGTRKMTEAIDLLKSEGIDTKDIKTTNYTLLPRYEYNEKLRRTFISDYIFNQTTSVKVRELGKVAKIITTIAKSGVNQINSVSFDVEDPEKYLGEARKQAFEKTLTKAKEMASKNGVKIKRVLNFSEFQGGPIPYYRAEGLGGGGDFAKAPLPTIEPGTQEVTVQVSVTYEIE